MGQNEIELEFNPDLFNEIYWRISEHFKNHALRFIFIYGGSSASKTFSVVQRLITLTFESQQENTLILRKYGTDIKDSIFADFKSIISDWGLSHFFTIQQNYIENTATGAFIRFRGLDDSEKVKGISQFKRVVMEELNQFDHEDLKQIKKRLRGRRGQQIIGLFNPIIMTHWIKKEIYDLEKWTDIKTTIQQESINAAGNMLFMRTNHLDNRWIVGPDFIDQHALDDFEHDRIYDENAYRVYGLGLWGYPRTGNEYYPSFKFNTHVGPVHPDPSAYIHITFDFNVVPYMTLLCAQITMGDNGRWQVGFYREYCPGNPSNSTKAVCTLFAGEHREYGGSIYFYGDYSGKSRNTLGIADIQHQYSIVEDSLRRWIRNGSDRVRVNASVQKRKNFMEAIFKGDPKVPIDIVFDPSMEKTIEDFMYLVQGPDGNKHKKMVTDKATGVRYQLRGHTSDAVEYLITSAFSDLFDKFK